MATRAQRIEASWYRKPSALSPLKLLSWLFCLLTSLRRHYYLHRQAHLWCPPVPVVVVGNINVGGTGKTPVLIALAELLTRRGFKVGIVSRGYGATPPTSPFLVTPSALAQDAGDEPLLIAERTNCPVVIDPKRPQAIQYLLNRQHCDVILSDDGLQHYRMLRHVEIAVLDASRGIGNGYCLPVGPLRESVSRLRSVDFRVLNGSNAKLSLNCEIDCHCQILPKHWFNLSTGAVHESLPLDSGRRVHAVAGIGNPQRFFATLRTLGLEPIEHPFPDHHQFEAQDLQFDEDLPVVMTEKDAVKCSAINRMNLWCLRVTAALDDDFIERFVARISREIEQLEVT